MEALWRLLLLSVAMLVGSYVAGSIPLAMTLAEDKLKLMSVLGAGLLVGTALAVIIPEGVHTLYSSQPDSHHHHSPSGAVELTKHITGSHSPHLEHHEGHAMETHSLIGVALVLGFIFMLLIDQISGGHSHTSHDPESTQAASTTTRNKMTVTLGLVVHAAADGVALGAAASTSQAHVEIIVFVAIMLHKAPAAFGLVSFLMHEGLDRSRIRKHLAIFSGAAPTLAIGTYIGLSQQSRETLTNINATGLAMLFSAGTFLYVATVHVLPEIQNMGTTRSTDSEGNVVIREQRGFKKLELCAMVTGALLPLVLVLGHHH